MSASNNTRMRWDHGLRMRMNPLPISIGRAFLLSLFVVSGSSCTKSEQQSVEAKELRALRTSLVKAQSADVTVEGHEDYDGELYMKTGKYHFVMGGKGPTLNEALIVEGDPALTENAGISSLALVKVVLHRPNQQDYEFEIAGDNTLRVGEGFRYWADLGLSDEFKRRLFALCRGAK